MIECVIETGNKHVIQDLYNRYYKRLEQHQLCFLFNDKNRIGQIFDVFIQYENDKCKLIGKCKIWKTGYNKIFDNL